MKPLKLLAQDNADLEVLSAALQDAILAVQSVRYDAAAHALTLRVSRYRHDASTPSRIEAGLRFDGVLSVKSQGIDRNKPDGFMVLLGLGFTAGDLPAGTLDLQLAGDGVLRLDVEAIDVTLADVGKPRPTKSIPDHDKTPHDTTPHG